MRIAALAVVLAAGVNLLAATKIAVTVVEQKTGRFVDGLQAGDFAVLEEKSPRQVESVETAAAGPLDIMLLLDTSLVGPAVQPVASSLISQLSDKDQMAVVGYHSSADLVQDFTSSKQILMNAIARVKYGNTPRVLDALSAVIRDGFDNAVYRRVVLLLTTGLDGGSSETEKNVVKLARRGGVSIYPVYVTGAERGLFEYLARQTGGAVFNLNDLRKNGAEKPGPRVFETVRKYYVVTVAGNLASDRLKVEARTAGKVFVSALVQE